jgi:CBS domain-containing protein
MLTVNDLMTVNPETIKPDTSLRRTIELMNRQGCRQLPVVDDDQLVGIVTDRDIRLVMNSPIILHELRQDAELLERVIVEGIMTPNPMTVTPDTPAYKAAEMLSTYKFGALPVVEGKALVGIITVTDFLDQFSEKRE